VGGPLCGSGFSRDLVRSIAARAYTDVESLCEIAAKAAPTGARAYGVGELVVYVILLTTSVASIPTIKPGTAS